MEKINQGRQFTFMRLNKSLNKNGETFTSCTVSARVTHPTELRKTPEGKSVISFVIPIQNRSTTIERMCGKKPSTDETGTTWADVTAWDLEAELFADYIQKHPRSVITIVGNMRVQDVQNKNGETYTRAKITMTGFDHKADLPSFNNDGDAASDSDNIVA